MEETHKQYELYQVLRSFYSIEMKTVFPIRTYVYRIGIPSKSLYEYIPYESI